MMQPDLILASSSKYRRDLLARLNLKFRCIAPQVDEAPLDNEPPLATSKRLAKAKCLTIAQKQPDSVVIASDQVANVNNQAISKPGNHETARTQLREMSGKIVIFHTSVCIYRREDHPLVEFTVPTKVEFRTLNDAEIERYLIKEEPYDCAGSAKSEGLGISLLKQIESNDPTALIGLPLIELSNHLRQLNLLLP